MRYILRYPSTTTVAAYPSPGRREHALLAPSSELAGGGTLQGGGLCLPGITDPQTRAARRRHQQPPDLPCHLARATPHHRLPPPPAATLPLLPAHSA